MTIESVNENNLDEAIEFLKSTSKIKDIDTKIVLNASVIIHENEIVGIVSYELFGKYALIRYFIFKKEIPSSVILELLNDVSIKAKNDASLNLITIVNSEEIKQLFLSLGFEIIDSNKIFIDENNIENTKFKDSFILRYYLNYCV